MTLLTVQSALPGQWATEASRRQQAAAPSHYIDTHIHTDIHTHRHTYTQTYIHCIHQSQTEAFETRNTFRGMWYLSHSQHTGIVLLISIFKVSDRHRILFRIGMPNFVYQIAAILKSMILAAPSYGTIIRNERTDRFSGYCAQQWKQTAGVSKKLSVKESAVKHIDHQAKILWSHHEAQLLGERLNSRDFVRNRADRKTKNNTVEPHHKTGQKWIL